MTNAHDQPKASSLDLGPHPDESIAKLRWFNLAMGGLHLLQGIAIVALSNNFRAPVTGSFLDGPPGTPTQLTELFSIPFGWGVAAFVFLSAIAHFLIAGPLFGAYSRQLRQGRTDFRWIEYALSASWMIVLIAMLTGASDFAALLGLFGVNAAMILFGLIAERSGQPGGSGWQLPFWLGTLFGAVPWIIIAINLWAPGQDSSAPTFVYVIFVTIFVFFDSFAVNFWLQYRRVGRWRSYLFGETAYVVLSLVAKSLLAWQVFAGALAS
ncbi:MAG: heliorhodopsin HeR [Candidatus Microthrix sp.]|nr:heliorhodopsin HeR [Candidatus Microthrix sp.]